VVEQADFVLVDGQDATPLIEVQVVGQIMRPKYLDAADVDERGSREAWV